MDRRSEEGKKMKEGGREDKEGDEREGRKIRGGGSVSHLRPSWAGTPPLPSGPLYWPPSAGPGWGGGRCFGQEDPPTRPERSPFRPRLPPPRDEAGRKPRQPAQKEGSPLPQRAAGPALTLPEPSGLPPPGAAASPPPPRRGRSSPASPFWHWGARRESEGGFLKRKKKRGKGAPGSAPPPHPGQKSHFPDGPPSASRPSLSNRARSAEGAPPGWGGAEGAAAGRGGRPEREGSQLAAPPPA